jgi:hypothetical protein
LRGGINLTPENVESNGRRKGKGFEPRLGKDLRGGKAIHQGNMDRLRMMISMVIILLGIGLTLTGLAVQPHSNPETTVQIVVWGMIVGGIVLVLCVVMLARRWKGRNGPVTTKDIVLALLVYFGIVTLTEFVVWWNIYGVEGITPIAGATLAMSISFFLASIFVWKRWEEKKGV